jgi:FeS assembly SUF system protein
MNGPYDLLPPGVYPPASPAGDEEKALAGAPLQPGAPVATRDQVIEAMRTVFDPEIPVNIYDMGLIYETGLAEDGGVEINMSLTSPSCPVAGTLPQSVADAVAAVQGVGEVAVELVWDPPWSPDLMSEDAKLALGME